MDGPQEGAGMRRWLVPLRQKAASRPRRTVATALGVGAVAALAAVLAFTTGGSPTRTRRSTSAGVSSHPSVRRPIWTDIPAG